MCKKLISILAVILLSIGAYAQPKLVTGTVVDGSGLSVIGASIVEKGTQNGVITDLDGHYSINVQAGATLEVSSIGYKTVLVTVGTQNVYDVTLEVDQLLLDEVVVVGYGVMKKSDLSGASTSIKESDLKGSIITSLDQSLQGRAAGVTSVQTSGAPGSSYSIRVRGQATINANAEPLYVIEPYGFSKIVDYLFKRLNIRCLDGICIDIGIDSDIDYLLYGTFHSIQLFFSWF